MFRSKDCEVGDIGVNALSLSLSEINTTHTLKVQFTIFLNTSHGLLFLSTHHDLNFHGLLIILHIYLGTGSSTSVHVKIPLTASFTTSSSFLHVRRHK